MKVVICVTDEYRHDLQTVIDRLTEKGFALIDKIEKLGVLYGTADSVAQLEGTIGVDAIDEEYFFKLQ